MSILDSNYADNVTEDNVPISIELLHQEGWEFSAFNRSNQDPLYPDITTRPIHGSDPWNPYWMVNKDRALGSIKLTWDYNSTHHQAVHWNANLWDIAYDPGTVVFEIDEKHFYAHTWGELKELTRVRQLEHQRDLILSKFES